MKEYGLDGNPSARDCEVDFLELVVENGYELLGGKYRIGGFEYLIKKGDKVVKFQFMSRYHNGNYAFDILEKMFAA